MDEKLIKTDVYERIIMTFKDHDAPLNDREKSLVELAIEGTLSEIRMQRMVEAIEEGRKCSSA
ncbi:hypothetical protein [Halalkalibacterium halodurans]|uniref:Uncharacterized protein n=1 Tax=Halalkalibacterium halodurans TaxID=86665 RepID=A0A0M0KIT4_ALKHA|nr:hypothetical protein [Halalkalibacterium halodurans]TPE68004.1 hypothetical protein AMD02_015700 [Halalkalibacterium halodurans]